MKNLKNHILGGKNIFQKIVLDHKFTKGLEYLSIFFGQFFFLNSLLFAQQVDDNFAEPNI